jgi:hypothetical protein
MLIVSFGACSACPYIDVVAGSSPLDRKTSTSDWSFEQGHVGAFFSELRMLETFPKRERA